MASPVRLSLLKSAPPAQTGSEALAQLQSGALSREGYLERRLELALLPWQGRLSSAQIDVMREALREQLRTDPVVEELLRGAMGQDPEGTE